MWASDDEAQTLEIVLGDDIAGVEVHMLYGVLEACDVITRSVLIKNTGSGNITIEKARAACLDMVYGDYDVIRFYGKHAMERNRERTHLGHGTLSFGSRRGTSSHQYNPAVILAVFIRFFFHLGIFVNMLDYFIIIFQICFVDRLIFRLCICLGKEDFYRHK